MKDDIQSQVVQCLQPLLGLSYFSDDHTSSSKLQLLIALSGGVDSVVLFHVLASLRAQLPIELRAMHVHHGLSLHADDWAAFCHSLCQQYNVPLQIFKVKVAENSGTGLEASARKVRYQALHGVNANFVVLAHHQNDQAETLLLQLVRGAGVKGLAAMPIVDKAKKRLRPLLHVQRKLIMQYAQRHHLNWVEDESNQNIDYARNFMRHDLLPQLEKRYPAITESLSRSATHMAEAAGLLDDLARQDAQLDKAFDLSHSSSKLSVAILLHLSQARAANLLRWWLAQHQQTMPSTHRLHEMLRQLCHAKHDAKVQVRLNQLASIYRYRGYVYIVNHQSKLTEFSFTWQGEQAINLPDGSLLYFKEVQGKGVAKRYLLSKTLDICPRSEGQYIKIHPKQPVRTLKYLFQKFHIPPWQRESYPLLYLENKLIAIPSIGVSASYQADSSDVGIEMIYSEFSSTKEND